MFKLLLIWRYFICKRVAWLAVLAVTLVVMLVLVVLSIMSGLLTDTRQRNHSWCGDLVISRDSLVGFDHYEEFISQLNSTDVVDAATGIIKTFGLASIEWRTGKPKRPVEIYGLQFAEFSRVTGIAKTLDRKIKGLQTPAQPSQEIPDSQQEPLGCIFGQYLVSYDDSERQWIKDALVGWPVPVTVFALSGKGLLAGSGSGEQKTFRYTGYSDSGLVRVDDSAMYVDFDVLAKLCWMDGSDGHNPRVNEIRIKLKKGVGLERGRKLVATAWQRFTDDPKRADNTTLLADVTVQTWKEYRRSSIAPAEKEKSLMTVVFGMIAMVVVFVVFAIFYMIVTEKIKDLGIVKSVGGSSWQVCQVFLGFGLLVGAVGAVLGTAIGAAIVVNSNEIEAVLNNWCGFKLWNPAMYAIKKIPDVVDVAQAIIIALMAVVASVLGAVLPARRAGRLEVVEALRVE